jgi:hypothetical protein
MWWRTRLQWRDHQEACYWSTRSSIGKWPSVTRAGRDESGAGCSYSPHRCESHSTNVGRRGKPADERWTQACKSCRRFSQWMASFFQPQSKQFPSGWLSKHQGTQQESKSSYQTIQGIPIMLTTVSMVTCTLHS